jgi:hypothetical protein
MVLSSWGPACALHNLLLFFLAAQSLQHGGRQLLVSASRCFERQAAFAQYQHDVMTAGTALCDDRSFHTCVLEGCRHGGHVLRGQKLLLGLQQATYSRFFRVVQAFGVRCAHSTAEQALQYPCCIVDHNLGIFQPSVGTKATTRGEAAPAFSISGTDVQQCCYVLPAQCRSNQHQKHGCHSFSNLVGTLCTCTACVPQALCISWGLIRPSSFDGLTAVPQLAACSRCTAKCTCCAAPEPEFVLCLIMSGQVQNASGGLAADLASGRFWLQVQLQTNAAAVAVLVSR